MSQENSSLSQKSDESADNSHACVQQMESDLRRFRLRLLQFALAPGLLLIPWIPVGLLCGEQILARVKGPNGETQIVQSFENAATRDYDMLFLGNSRIYRGLNPDEFSIPSYNFAADNDTFNQMYYKLKWVRDQGKEFRYLAMGVDFFQFAFIDYRKNHLYRRYVDPAFLDDYEPHSFDGLRLYVRKLTRELNPKYVFMSTENVPFIRDNGQYVRPGTASPTDSVVRDTNRLPIQVDYFEKILNKCQEADIHVFLCMLPIRPAEQRAYDEAQIAEFMTFIRGYTSDSVSLIDLTFDESYVLSDYTDITHLNERAADRLSGQLSHLISASLQDSSHLFRFASESKTESLPQ